MNRFAKIVFFAIPTITILFFCQTAIATPKTFPWVASISNTISVKHREFIKDTVTADTWTPNFHPVINVIIVHNDGETDEQVLSNREQIVKNSLIFWEKPKGVFWVARLSAEYKIPYVEFTYDIRRPADLTIDFRPHIFFTHPPGKVTVGRADGQTNTIYINGEKPLSWDTVPHEFGHIIQMAHNNDIIRTYAGDNSSGHVYADVQSIMTKHAYAPSYEINGDFLYSKDELILLEQEFGPTREYMENWLKRRFGSDLSTIAWGYMPAWTWPGKWPFDWDHIDGPYDDRGEWIQIEYSTGDTLKSVSGGTTVNYEYHDDVAGFPDLIAHYAFENNTQDSSGNNNHGLSYGRINYVQGVFGFTAEFNGFDSYIEIPKPDIFKFKNQSVSFSLWVQIRDNIDEYRQFIALMDHPDFFPGIGFAKARSGWNSGRLYFEIGQTTTSQIDVLSAKTGVELEKNIWMHLVGVINHEDSTVKLYKNGMLESTQEIISYDLSAASNLRFLIGTGWNRNGLDGYHNGLIDEICIFNRALSEVEILQLYTMSPSKMIPTSFSNSGLWVYRPTYSEWHQITPSTPENIICSGATLYAEFGAGGIWMWNGTSWTMLTPSNPENMVVAGSNLYAEFGAGGIWMWNGSSWTMLTPSNPENMVVAGSNLCAEFGAGGIWMYNGTSWTMLTSSNPENMVAGSGSNIYAEFGAGGIWMFNGSTWTMLSPSNPESMVAAGSLLYADFGAGGIYMWNGSAWRQIANANPESMVTSGSLLYADFGAGGLYMWNGTSWAMIANANAENMVPYGTTLFADFGGGGLYSWNGTAWTMLTPSNPIGMAVPN